jgi:uncharacterized membrane protein
MESLAIVLLLTVLGGGGLFVALIYAILTATSRSEELKRLDAEQTRMRMALHDAFARIAHLERTLAEGAARAVVPEITPVVAPVPVVAPPPAAAVSVAVSAAPQPAEKTESRGEPPAAESEAQVAPTPPRVEPPRVEPPPARFDWERWIGVRGAAALGACVLVIAGLYFFKYSIEEGLISPPLRVLLGTGVGLGGLFAAERRLRPKHAVLANWLAGAAIAILYTAFWSANALYGLVGAPLAFGLMIAVTAAACALSARHGASAIALLGLLGGFATPLALSTGEDHPIGLFGYLLLLDAALLYLAHARRWPWLGAASFAGTALYQVAWIGARMGAADLGIGIGVLVIFGAAYAVASPDAQVEESQVWTLTRAGAILMPFAFGLYFGLRSDLGEHLYPLALMLTLLAAGAAWTARSKNAGWAVVAAAVAGTTVIGAWLAVHDRAAIAWEASICAALFAAVLHGFAEIERRRPRPGVGMATTNAAAIASFGTLLCVLASAVAPSSADPWPWLAGALVAAALAVRQARAEGREALHVALAGIVGLGLPLVQTAHASVAGFPAAPLWLGIALVLALAAQGLAWTATREPARRWASHGAGLVALLLMGTTLARSASPAPAPLLFLAAIALAALVLAAATRLASSGWLLAAALGLALTEASLASSLGAESATIALAAQAFGVVLVTAWPLFAARLRDDAWAWRAAALAGPLAYPGLHFAWRLAFGGAATALVPLAIGAVTLGIALAARPRTTRTTWLYAVSVVAVSIAIPQAFENEWTTIGWALYGLALAALWRRVDHAGLKYAAIAHLGLATVLLVANPDVLGYHPHAAVPILNWIATTYGIPAAALLGAARLLRDSEVSRARAWESGLYAKRRPVLALSAAAAAIVVLFAWVNLTILDAFATGSTLQLPAGRLPARDLTLSFAWALYALGLLALGMARRSAALRWSSLGLVIVTVGKVFLYDLSHLHDLYRVVSLVGLALSLIVISLAYQRFVFGKAHHEEAR